MTLGPNSSVSTTDSLVTTAMTVDTSTASPPTTLNPVTMATDDGHPVHKMYQVRPGNNNIL